MSHLLDLTDLSLAERTTDAGLTAQSKLLAAEPWIGRIIDAMPHPVAILNEHRQVVGANPSLLVTLGLQNLEQAIGSRPGELTQCPFSQVTGDGCGTTPSCQSCGAFIAIRTSQSGHISTKDCSIVPVGQHDPMSLRISG